MDFLRTLLQDKCFLNAQTDAYIDTAFRLFFEHKESAEGWEIVSNVIETMYSPYSLPSLNYTS